MSGGKAQTIMELFDTVDVDITLLGARLGAASKYNYQLYDPSSGIFVPFTYLHDQYLFGGSVSSGVPDMLKIGVNYTEITDSKDTGSTPTAPSLDNYVTSVNGELKLKFGEGSQAKVNAEFADSHYTNNKWYQNYITDTAIKAGAEATFMNSTLSASYSAVGNSYTAYAAQTRIYNFNIAVPYLTQNSMWNIANKPPSYNMLYPFTQYNPTINVSYGNPSGSAATGLAYKATNLLFYPIYENNTMPYGDSTPNRDSLVLKYSGNYLDGLIQPSVKYQMANEIVTNLAVTYTVKPRDFSVVEAGVKSEFTLGIPWALTVGYKSEDTNNGQTNSIAFTSNTLDAGLEATIIKKKLMAYVGYKDIAFNGTEYMLSSGSYSLFNFDDTISSVGVGFEYNIAKPAVIGMSFTNTLLAFNKFPTANYDAQEFDIKVSISF